LLKSKLIGYMQVHNVSMKYKLLYQLVYHLLTIGMLLALKVVYVERPLR